METKEYSYEDALFADMGEVREITASSGAIDRIREFGNLRSLSISENRSITDFAFLSQLPKLEKLFIADMELSQIPPQVADLKKLTTLFIGQNPIKDFSLLAQLPDLIDLGLEEMGLKKIPDEVLAKTKLKILGLYDNNIGAIAALKKLPELEELYIASNKLKKIPKELTRLAKLRKLDIMHNYSLSDWGVLGELKQLEELSMTNAHAIKALPAEIFELSNLRSLSLSIHWNAPADTLDGLAKIDQLDKLEELTIHGTSAHTLPETFGKLKKLKKLDLSDNKKLTNVDALRDLPELVELDLSKCGLLGLGDSLSTLKSLVKLNLNQNHSLEDLSGLRDLPALEELRFFSKLKSLPNTMGTLTNLRKLELGSDGAEVSFLAKFGKLEELYLANCSDGMVPAELSKLQKLTLFAKTSDVTIAAYPELKELEVSASSFTLPFLPQLHTLSVGGIVDGLELSNIGELPLLRNLAIHRSESLVKIPDAVASAQSLVSITLEFLKLVTDISAIHGLPKLSELKLAYLKKLKALPPEFATLKGLRKLRINDAKELADLDVLGELSGLVELELDELDQLKALPASMANLKELRRLKLDDLENLKDISVLEKLAGLEELDVDDCDGLPRKLVAKFKNAMATRGEAPAATSVSYQQFIDSGMYKALSGKEDKTQSYSFPLWFDEAKTLLDALEDYSWLDDYRDDEETEEWGILNDPDSALKPVAILDLGFEGCDTDCIDAYSEEIFLVDTADARNPVLLWGHDGSPAKIHDSFDLFLANLRNFTQEKADDDSSENEGEGDAKRTYLEFVDAKSSKFWQVVVEGSAHTVTFGKIGTNGSSKSKDFADEAAAQKDADKLIASKLKKGYGPAKN